MLTLLLRFYRAITAPHAVDPGRKLTHELGFEPCRRSGSARDVGRLGKVKVHLTVLVLTNEDNRGDPLYELPA